jgi:hypothetical protein
MNTSNARAQPSRSVYYISSTSPAEGYLLMQSHSIEIMQMMHPIHAVYSSEHFQGYFGVEVAKRCTMSVVGLRILGERSHGREGHS